MHWNFNNRCNLVLFHAFLKFTIYLYSVIERKEIKSEINELHILLNPVTAPGI